jgi:hypothetical protein
MKRTVYDSAGLGRLVHELGCLPHPFSVTIRTGRDRSLSQNALAWKWAGEIAAHLGDRTANEVHAHNKLHHGVPIRRETDDDFRRVYDERIKPLTYEAKLALMAPPIDLPVTRDMKVKEMTRFMDAVREAWAAQGVALTDPEAMKYQGEMA